jgi:hypothetical protein
MFRIIRIFFLAMLILTVSAQPLLAEFAGMAPEIDPSLAPSALALVTGGLLILRSKIKR